MKSKILGLLAAGLLTCSMAEGAVATISNEPSDPASSITPFGADGTPTYGQVFKAPVTGTLDSFTLYLDSGVGSLFGGVGTWNAPNEDFGVLFGSPTNLYQSSNVVSNGGGAYTFNPNISVTSGELYVAYLSVWNVAEANPDLETGMPLGDDSDPNILYFVFNNSSDAQNNPSWDYFSNFGEVQFSATFTEASVPEPTTLALLGLGMTGLAFVRRRRSSRC